MRFLVTGASRGIGRSIALRVARDAFARGHVPSIVLTGTGNSADVGDVAAELRESGANVLTLVGDLTDPVVPGRMVEKAVEFCGGLDALVHNAGGVSPRALEKTSYAAWSSVFALNCHAFFLLGVAALPALRDSGGSLCAIGSIAAEHVSALRVKRNLNAYGPAKAALHMLVRQMAYEWGRYGIRVNGIAPGLTVSRSTEKLLDSAFEGRLREFLPLRRLERPDDVANAVSFILGPDASYITGEIINVDGGQRHIGLDSMFDGAI